MPNVWVLRAPSADGRAGGGGARTQTHLWHVCARKLRARWLLTRVTMSLPAILSPCSPASGSCSLACGRGRGRRDRGQGGGGARSSGRTLATCPRGAEQLAARSCASTGQAQQYTDQAQQKRQLQLRGSYARRRDTKTKNTKHKTESVCVCSPRRTCGCALFSPSCWPCRARHRAGVQGTGHRAGQRCELVAS